MPTGQNDGTPSQVAADTITRRVPSAVTGAIAKTLRFALILVPLALAACGQSASYGHGVNNAKLIAVTSPIPGAQARLLAATTAESNAAPTSNFCVTDAGYCPLAAAASPGRNCLCVTGTLMYGGRTGIPPQTYVPDSQ